MRLLHTERLEFGEFFDDAIPKYSTLSHRWSAEEVSFEQFLAGERKNGYGYKKILKLCEISRSLNHEWTWIDTCCIDKRSSSELSEAINSMYAWYMRSVVCFVFLPDVLGCSESAELQYPKADEEPTEDDPTGRVRFPDSAVSFYRKQFQNSVWWTRGWTLQELLAPNDLVFYNDDCNIIGTRDTMSNLISTITGIETLCLRKDSRREQNIQQTSFATKMIWASNRETARAEDRIYCLLGLLNLNMPLLYGEGPVRAFTRMQAEYQQSELVDDSLYVWERRQRKPGENRLQCHAMLAYDPSDFHNSRVTHASRATIDSWLDVRLIRQREVEICLPAVFELIHQRNRYQTVHVLFALNTCVMTNHKPEYVFLLLNIHIDPLRRLGTDGYDAEAGDPYVLRGLGPKRRAVNIYKPQEDAYELCHARWEHLWIVHHKSCTHTPKASVLRSLTSNTKLLSSRFWSKKTIRTQLKFLPLSPSLSHTSSNAVVEKVSHKRPAGSDFKNRSSVDQTRFQLSKKSNLSSRSLRSGDPT